MELLLHSVLKIDLGLSLIVVFSRLRLGLGFLRLRVCKLQCLDVVGLFFLLLTRITKDETFSNVLNRRVKILLHATDVCLVVTSSEHVHLLFR